LHINYFFARKSEKQSCFLHIETTPKPPETARQKQNYTKLVKSARNPPEIGSQPEIFFARQMTFKSARIRQAELVKSARNPPEIVMISVRFSP
jgi:hypothetical protein